MDFTSARFETVLRDETSAIIGRIAVGVDVEVVLYDLNGVMVAAAHPVVFSPVSLRFALLPDDDRRSLGSALQALQQRGELLDDLWLQVMVDSSANLPTTA